MTREFLQKARENLEDARVAFEQARYNASANRAYYASFQAAIAALGQEGITKKDNPHSWVQAQFSGILIRQKKLYSSTLKSYLLEMQALRDDADYTKKMVSRANAQKQLKQATEFVSSIQRNFHETQS